MGLGTPLPINLSLCPCLSILITNVGEDVEKLELSCIAGGNIKWGTTLQNSAAVPQKG